MQVCSNTGRQRELSALGRRAAPSHLLNHVSYKPIPTHKVKLPHRKIGKYKAVDHPFKYIADKF